MDGPAWRTPGIGALYASVRTLLRTKLALFHIWDVEPGRHERWRAEGRACLQLARRHIPGG